MKSQQAQKMKMDRVFRGIVSSAKGEKTIIVEVTRELRHKLYGKLYKRTRKFHVHDEKNECAEGDVVEFVECRPMSKNKRWRLSKKIVKVTKE